MEVLCVHGSSLPKAAFTQMISQKRKKYAYMYSTTVFGCLHDAVLPVEVN